MRSLCIVCKLAERREPLFLCADCIGKFRDRPDSFKKPTTKPDQTPPVPGSNNRDGHGIPIPADEEKVNVAAASTHTQNWSRLMSAKD